MMRPCWATILLGFGLLLLPADDPALGQAQRRPGVSPAERAFLDRHWRRPIPPQGAPPERFSPVERSLAPPSCGTCHPVQFADWKTSLHSKSMGPGVAGQLVEMVRTDPEDARTCLNCHAPLAEQASQTPAFDASLQTQGLVCAGCHVRGYQRFGPPRREGSRGVAAPRQSLPHNGVTRTRAFLQSEFCASCHQFQPDGFALNGTLLENTYEEWRASPFAARGVECQDCHMPDRRHLWRGIHDPETVRGALRITLEAQRPGDEAVVTLTIASVGVGHHFPTYVTPLVVVRGELIDRAGRPVPGSAEERMIGRQVALNLSRQIADTRIPAGGQARFVFRRRVDRTGLRFRGTVTVRPDEFYAGFYESLLAAGAGAGTAQIREAQRAARGSAFVIFERDVPLTRE